MTRMRDKVSKFGRLVSCTHHPRRARRGGEGTTGILTVRVEMIINLFRHGLVDACNPLEVAETGPRDRPRRAEMMQKSPLATRSDPGNLLQRRAFECFRPLGAMGADCEAVRLVSQSL